jgi:hypothetical protein
LAHTACGVKITLTQKIIKLTPAHEMSIIRVSAAKINKILFIVCILISLNEALPLKEFMRPVFFSLVLLSAQNVVIRNNSLSIFEAYKAFNYYRSPSYGWRKSYIIFCSGELVPHLHRTLLEVERQR